MGISDEHLLVNRRKPRAIENHQSTNSGTASEYFLVMRKAIHFDRSRRKAIMEGKL